MVKMKMKKKRESTEFEKEVYKLCKSIPKGKVSTYGVIAKEMQKEKAVRAVGSALKKNPFAPIVPCHRVVRADLSIGGFRGCLEGLEINEKKRLLIEEGVEFEPDSFRISKKCLHIF